MFDSTMERLDQKQQALAAEAESAKSLAACHEMERDRLHAETVDHLLQTDHLAKEVSRLEQTVASKNQQVRVSCHRRVFFI